MYRRHGYYRLAAPLRVLSSHPQVSSPIVHSSPSFTAPARCVIANQAPRRSLNRHPVAPSRRLTQRQCSGRMRRTYEQSTPAWRSGTASRLEAVRGFTQPCCGSPARLRLTWASTWHPDPHQPPLRSPQGVGPEPRWPRASSAAPASSVTPASSAALVSSGRLPSGRAPSTRRADGSDYSAVLVRRAVRDPDQPAHQPSLGELLTLAGLLLLAQRLADVFKRLLGAIPARVSVGAGERRRLWARAGACSGSGAGRSGSRADAMHVRTPHARVEDLLMPRHACPRPCPHARMPACPHAHVPMARTSRRSPRLPRCPAWPRGQAGRGRGRATPCSLPVA